MAQCEIEQHFAEKWDYWFSRGLHDIVLAYMKEASKHLEDEDEQQIFLELAQQGYNEAKERFITRCLTPCEDCGAPTVLSATTVMVDDEPGRLHFSCTKCEASHVLPVLLSSGMDLQQKRKRLDELARLFVAHDIGEVESERGTQYANTSGVLDATVGTATDADSCCCVSDK